MRVELSSTSLPGKDEAFDVSSAGVSLALRVEGPALFFHAAETADLRVLLPRTKCHTSEEVSYVLRSAI
jgi:hypothetical protein